MPIATSAPYISAAMMPEMIVSRRSLYTAVKMMRMKYRSKVIVSLRTSAYPMRPKTKLNFAIVRPANSETVPKYLRNVEVMFFRAK